MDNVIYAWMNRHVNCQIDRVTHHGGRSEIRHHVTDLTSGRKWIDEYKRAQKYQNLPSLFNISKEKSLLVCYKWSFVLTCLVSIRLYTSLNRKSILPSFRMWWYVEKRTMVPRTCESKIWIRKGKVEVLRFCEKAERERRDLAKET